MLNQPRRRVISRRSSAALPEPEGHKAVDLLEKLLGAASSVSVRQRSSLVLQNVCCLQERANF